MKKYSKEFALAWFNDHVVNNLQNAEKAAAYDLAIEALMNYRTPEPKFKIGESLRTWKEATDNITEGISFIVEISDDYYVCNNKTIPVNRQDEYEYPAKFCCDDKGRYSNDNC